MRNALGCIMDVDAAQMPAAAQLQMTLPMRHGGLGLFKLTPEASEAAYLTCAAQAHAVLKDAARTHRSGDREGNAASAARGEPAPARR